MHKWLRRYASQALMVIVAVVTLYPVFFIYNNALKSNMDISKSFLSIANTFFLGGFEYIVVKKQAYLFMLNSIYVVAGSLVICLGLAVAVSFRISRFRVRFGNQLYIFFLMGLVLSHHSSIVPVFLILKGLHLLNTHFGLMLAFSAWNLSLAILIFTAFFRSIPGELQNAATIDGCSNTGFLLRVVLPLSTAPICTAALLTTVFIWNDLMFPMTLINSPNKKLVSASLIYFKGQYFADYNLLFSAIAFMILPLIVLYWIFQKYFVSGVFAGAIKQ